MNHLTRWRTITATTTTAALAAGAFGILGAASPRSTPPPIELGPEPVAAAQADPDELVLQAGDEDPSRPAIVSDTSAVSATSPTSAASTTSPVTSASPSSVASVASTDSSEEPDEVTTDDTTAAAPARVDATVTPAGDAARSIVPAPPEGDQSPTDPASPASVDSPSSVDS